MMCNRVALRSRICSPVSALAGAALVVENEDRARNFHDFLLALQAAACEQACTSCCW